MHKDRKIGREAVERSLELTTRNRFTGCTSPNKSSFTTSFRNSSATVQLDTIQSRIRG